jgi:hypothetical protein
MDELERYYQDRDLYVLRLDVSRLEGEINRLKTQVVRFIIATGLTSTLAALLLTRFIWQSHP